MSFNACVGARNAAGLGPPCPSDTGVVYECVAHRKERIVAEQAAIRTPVRSSRKLKVPHKAEEIPVTPHLETAEPAILPELRTSASSGNLPTGASLGELPVKRKELRGRRIPPDKECRETQIRPSQHIKSTEEKDPNRESNSFCRRSLKSIRGRSTGPNIPQSAPDGSVSHTSESRDWSEKSERSSAVVLRHHQDRFA